MPTYDKTRGTWKALARVRAIDKQVFLGRFATKDQATAVEHEFRIKHPIGKRKRANRVYKVGLPRDDNGRWVRG